MLYKKYWTGKKLVERIGAYRIELRQKKQKTKTKWSLCVVTHQIIAPTLVNTPISILITNLHFYLDAQVNTMLVKY